MANFNEKKEDDSGAFWWMVAGIAVIIMLVMFGWIELVMDWYCRVMGYVL